MATYSFSILGSASPHTPHHVLGLLCQRDITIRNLAASRSSERNEWKMELHLELAGPPQATLMIQRLNRLIDVITVHIDEVH